MRTRSLLTALVVALAATGQAQDTRPGIAVLEFHNAGSYGQDKENFDALQKGIAGMLISELAVNPSARVVERDRVRQIIDELKLADSGLVSAQTAARVGKLVQARYVVTGQFIDFYGDFRLDLRLVNVETSEIVKTHKEQMRRDHLFDIIRSAAQRLMKDANLPPLAGRAQQERSSRHVPTEALTFYSRALLYQDRGDRAKATEMYQKAIDLFPEYAEARDGLQRVRG
jgi:TolB-like protein